MRYKAETVARAKQMYIVEGMSAKEISKHFHSQPTHQTISNWVGKYKWNEERADYEAALYENLAPQQTAQKILNKINALVSKDDRSFTTKDADSLMKLQKSLTSLIDKKYQIPIMFKLLTEFLNYIQKHYQSLVSDDLVQAARDFKEIQLRQFQS